MSFGHSRNATKTQAARPGPRWIRAILLLPFLAVFGVPGHDMDALVFGVSVIYWYQALWIAIAAALVYTVYRVENQSTPEIINDYAKSVAFLILFANYV